MIYVGNIYAGLGGGGGGVNIYNSDGTLTASRTVTMGSDSLSFEGTDGVGNSLNAFFGNTGVEFQAIDSDNDQSQISQSGSNAFLVAIREDGDNAEITAQASTPGDYVIAALLITTGGKDVSVQASTLSPGIEVKDQLSAVGFIADSSILKANILANPKAYVTTECLSAYPQIVNSWDIFASGSGISLAVQAVPNVGTGWIVRISVYVTVQTITAGTIQVFADFTNTKGAGGTAQTIAVTGVINALGEPVSNPIIIKAFKGTNIALRTATTGAVDYDCGGTIELMVAD